MPSIKKSGGAKKYGRNKESCKKYMNEMRRERNKLKRIVKYNGREYAKKWCATCETGARYRPEST